MRRRVLAGLGAAVLAIAGSVALVTVGPLGTEAVDTCVHVWEQANATGDNFAVCSTTASNVKVANLSTRTDNLHDGCWRTVNASSTWNDCISYTSIGNLPSGYRVRFYLDSSYQTIGYCFQDNGQTNANLAGAGAERISSFRVEAGNCP